MFILKKYVKFAILLHIVCIIKSRGLYVVQGLGIGDKREFLKEREVFFQGMAPIIKLKSTIYMDGTGYAWDDISKNALETDGLGHPLPGGFYSALANFFPKKFD
jgi:hypothetical protein